MSELKRKIQAFQQDGDRTIINDIMSAVEKDFMRNGTRTRVKDGTQSGGIRISLSDHYEYIAYRIRAMQELLMRHYKLEFSDNVPYLNEFQRYLSIIYIDFKIRFNATIYDQSTWLYYFNLTPELFEELEKHMSELEKRFTKEEFRHFKWMFDKFRASVSEIQDEKDGRLKEIRETAVAALEYALKYVDTNRSDKEIVKYINMTFSSKLADAEAKRNGLRRIQRKSPNGKRVSYLVKPYFPNNIYRVILGFDFSDSLDQLNDNQREFIREVYKVVEADKIAGDTTNYTCETDGEVRISKKYIAEKLGLREDLVRKKLQRIKKKVEEVSRNTSIFKP